MRNAYVVAIQRSAVTKAGKGGLSTFRPDDLLAALIQSMMREYPTLADRIEDVVIGCALQEGPQAGNIARNATLLAGLPDHTPAVTVNRLCSSGLQSIVYAAERVMLGLSDVVLAGGVESMSMVPFTPSRFSINPRLFDAAREDIGMAYGMGLTAERVAEKYQISREDQDQYALESHRRALHAIQSGWKEAEILAIDVPHWTPAGTESVSVLEDEGPRQDTSLEMLSRLPTVFKKKGTVTAGNSSQISDGAGIALIVSEPILKTLHLSPLARYCGFAVTGVAPEEMGIGPITAIPKVLKQLGLTLTDLDWIELNEAFAAQTLAVLRTLHLDPDQVNPMGGAIALGHPLGASGTLRTATLLHGLRRTQGRYGMVSLCVGVGMGTAAVFERV